MLDTSTQQPQHGPRMGLSTQVRLFHSPPEPPATTPWPATAGARPKERSRGFGRASPGCSTRLRSRLLGTRQHASTRPALSCSASCPQAQPHLAASAAQAPSASRQPSYPSAHQSYGNYSLASSQPRHPSNNRSVCPTGENWDATEVKLRRTEDADLN